MQIKIMGGITVAPIIPKLPVKGDNPLTTGCWATNSGDGNADKKIFFQLGLANMTW